MIKTKTVRITAGEYQVCPLPMKNTGNRYVTISRIDFWDGPGWVAAAQWDHNRHTDPLPTKHEAVQSAQQMLDDIYAELYPTKTRAA